VVCSQIVTAVGLGMHNLRAPFPAHSLANYGCPPKPPPAGPPPPKPLPTGAPPRSAVVTQRQSAMQDGGKPSGARLQKAFTNSQNSPSVDMGFSSIA